MYSHKGRYFNFRLLFRPWPKLLRKKTQVFSGILLCLQRRHSPDPRFLLLPGCARGSLCCRRKSSGFHVHLEFQICHPALLLATMVLQQCLCQSVPAWGHCAGHLFHPLFSIPACQSYQPNHSVGRSNGALRKQRKGPCWHPSSCKEPLFTHSFFLFLFSIFKYIYMVVHFRGPTTFQPKHQDGSSDYFRIKSLRYIEAISSTSSPTFTNGNSGDLGRHIVTPEDENWPLLSNATSRTLLHTGFLLKAGWCGISPLGYSWPFQGPHCGRVSENRLNREANIMLTGTVFLAEAKLWVQPPAWPTKKASKYSWTEKKSSHNF